MANFIFDQAATLMLSGGLDWVNTGYSCALIDDSVSTPTQSSDWSAISGGLVASVALSNKTITTHGAAAADPAEFANVSPSDPNGRFLGIAVVRTSDNLPIAWLDTGFNNLGSAGPVPIGVASVSAGGLTFTFSLLPGIDNEKAWFRP